jgi:hypothetical protein
MKTVVWAGPCSSEAGEFKDYLELNYRGLTQNLLKSIAIRVQPFLIVSENWQDLLDTYLDYPSAKQIYFCRENDFYETLKLGIRPLNRFYFLYHQSSLEEFRSLLNQIEAEAQFQLRPPGGHVNPIPSMQNSLAVLKKLNDERLFALHSFSRQEEERRKNFRSLIQLARSLSMSRDIEEVMQRLWFELKTLDGVIGLSLLITDQLKRTFSVTMRSGKFHFEEINLSHQNSLPNAPGLTSKESEKFLRSLEPEEVIWLNAVLKQNVSRAHICSLSQDQDEKTFVLILETKAQWYETPSFTEYLNERLSFIRLTIEKHLLQEEIKSKAALWADTFDELQDPLAILTQKRQIVRANRRYQINEDSTCHRIWGDPERLCPDCPSVVDQKNSFQLQHDQKVYQARVFPIFDSTSTPRSFVAHYVDVTAEKTLYGRLLQSEKMAAIGKLADDLSTALSAPLDRIIEVTETIVSSEEATGQLHHDLSEINKAAKRSLRIMGDFENFSKGKIEKIPILAETVIEKTIPLIKALIHGHRFQLQLSEQKHQILGSLSLLQQVLYNLLRNAHQAMTRHGELIISTESKSRASTPGVQICVLDSGPGLPEEVRARLFKPFVTTRSDTGGTGLGLNIVKQIVESHLGAVGYEPRPEGGSKFWIWLPTKEEDTQ